MFAPPALRLIANKLEGTDYTREQDYCLQQAEQSEVLSEKIFGQNS